MLKYISAATIFLSAVMLCRTDASEFAKLTEKVPRGANAILLIDVDKTLASPIAKAKSWQSRLEQGASDRPMYLPPEADKIVVAALLDEVRGFNRIWEVALMGLKEPMPISLVARAEGGYTDNINGVNVAWVPSDAYFIDIDSSTLGLMAPAERQAVSRWAARAKRGGTMEISDYLGAAATAVSQGPQIVLAIDAVDAVQPHRVREKLEKSEYVQKHSLKPDDLLKLISGLRGVVLKITLTDKINASARIDFSTPVGLNETAAKGLVLQALESMQMELPDTENWNCSVTGNSVLFEGEFSTDGLRRVLSLMEVPTTKFSSLKDANVEEASGDDMAKNSLAYFKAVDSMLKDLKSKSKSANSDAYWIDKYASKIDRLPILHVDEDLLVYGEQLSETLRIMSGSRKMTNLQGGVASRSDLNTGNSYYSGTGYGYGSYSYSTARSRARNAGVDRANAAASGTVTKLEGWNLIDNATVEIRREMTKRYNMEF